MPFSSDSSDSPRRNVFDVPPPVLAGADGAGDPKRSIFSAPTTTSTAAGRDPARPERARAVARPLATAVAVLALVFAAALLSVVLASDGEPEPSAARAE